MVTLPVPACGCGAYALCAALLHLAPGRSVSLRLSSPCMLFVALAVICGGKAWRGSDAVGGTGWRWAEVVWRNLVRLSCTLRLLAHGSVQLAALDPPLVRVKSDHLELGLR